MWEISRFIQSSIEVIRWSAMRLLKRICGHFAVEVYVWCDCDNLKDR